MQEKQRNAMIISYTGVIVRGLLQDRAIQIPLYFSLTLRGEVWVHNTSLTPPLLIEMSVRSRESECLVMYVCARGTKFDYDFSIGFCNCYDSVVLFVLHFSIFSCGNLNIRAYANPNISNLVIFMNKAETVHS